MPRVEAGEMPDTARRFARAVLAMRLVFGGPITVGPVLFERVDWAPRAVRALPASVTQVLPGEPVRLDPQKLYMVRALADRMADAEVHGGPDRRRARSLGLCQRRRRGRRARGRAGRRRRTAARRRRRRPPRRRDARRRLVGANAADREDIAIAMQAALRLSHPDAPLSDTENLAIVVGDIARSVLAAALDHGADASKLGATLDAVLLGSRPRPQSVTNLVRSA